MRRFYLGLVVGCLFTTLPAYAQGGESLLKEGIKAFQKENYQHAEELLKQSAKASPDNSKVHYLLSKLYYDTPLKDVNKASDEIHAALSLDPANVKFKVARLQLLRRDASNFIVEQLRAAKRRELAHEILHLDSTNAFAHEELGISYIRDFWRYHNAISIPNLSFRSTPQNRQLDRAKQQRRKRRQAQYTPTAPQIDRKPPSIEQSPTENLRSMSSATPLGVEAKEVFVADRFDMKALKDKNIPIQDLSARADYAYARAIGHLKKSIAYDPRRRSIYDHLMQIFALNQDWHSALDMLGDMYVVFPKDTKMWLYLGYVHHELGQPKAASKSFKEAFRFMKPKTRAAFSNIEYFLSDKEEKAYRKDSLRYAARFWTSKDPRYLTPVNERKMEHYARLVYADLLYAAPDLDKRGWETKRGRILVRYGKPQINAVILSNPAAGNPLDVLKADNTFAESVKNQPIYNIWDYGAFRFVFEDPLRNGSYRLYSPSAHQIGTGGSLPWDNDYVLKARETFRKHPDRYHYANSARRVELPYVVTTFQGDSAQTDVYVNYGIPLNQQGQIDSMLNVTAQVGAYLIGADRNVLAQRRRTIYGLKPAQIHTFKKTKLWMGTQQLQAHPEANQLSMEFETAGKGAFAVQRRDVKVPQYGEKELEMSDLLLAYQIEAVSDSTSRGGGARIVRDGLSMQPAPWNVFGTDQPIYIYFEGYNLSKKKQQTDYAVEAALAPKDTDTGVTKFIRDLFGGGPEPGVSVQFTGAGRKTDAGQYFIINAKDEEPGVYTLVVRLTDRVTGQTVEKKRNLYLE